MSYKLKCTLFWHIDELPGLQVNPDKLRVINELVDKSIALVVLGYSNIARAVLANELVGGKPLFPVVSNTNPVCTQHFNNKNFNDYR